MKHFFQMPSSASPVRSKRTATALRLAAATLSIAVLSLVIVGCGGGGNAFKSIGSGSGQVSRKTGGMSLTVTWPERSRLIPDAANSITVVVTKDGNTLRQQTLTRPAVGEPLTTTVTFEDLPAGGGYLVTATAFPEADASGEAQAKSAAVPFTVDDAKVTRVAVTMNSTIDGLELLPPSEYQGINYELGSDRSLLFTVNAYHLDENGNKVSVIISPKKITFTLGQQVAGTAILTPEESTPSVADALLQIVSAPTSGTVKVTVNAKDEESGKTTSLDLNVSATGINTEAAWSKFHADARNTGRLSVSRTAPSGTLSPFFKTDGSIIFSSPAVDKDGTVYIGSYDKNIYAINPNGTVKWAVTTGGVVESSPVIGKDGSIYAGSSDGKLYIIDSANGSVLHTFTADGPIYGSPTLDQNGIVYFGTTDDGHSLYAVDGLSGLQKWKYSSPGAGIANTPAVVTTGGTTVVYFGSLDGKVYAVNGKTGVNQLTPFTLPDAGDSIFSSSCAVGDEGTIYVGTLSGKMYALSAGGAALTSKWSVDAGAPIYGTPALSRDGSTLYIGTLDNFSGLNESHFLALNTANGATKWSFDPEDGITASAAIGWDDTVYITSLDHNLYALNSDGSLKWKVTLTQAPGSTDSPSIESSPGFGPDGAIYFGSTDGNVRVVK